MRTVAIIALLLLASPAHACRLALVLALDVSGSVDAGEYRLQMDGLAEALDDTDVRAALFSMPGAPVSLAVFEWSSSQYQLVVQDWVTITDEAVLAGLINRLRGWQREPAPEATGLGAAMAYGKRMLDRAPVCWKRTLDVSADGKNNDWPTPRDLQQSGLMGDVLVNALVVTRAGDGDMTPEAGELVSYFKALVIKGPDAFVEVALGFDDYADAMRRKLLKELETRPMGALRTPRQYRP